MSDLLEMLLPRPRHVQQTGGVFRPTTALQLSGNAADSPLLTESLDELTRVIATASGQPVALTRDAPTSEKLVITRTESPADAPSRSGQSYTLTIAPRSISLTAPTDLGLRYGLQTLTQIANRGGTEWPCLSIEDQPDFAVRGVSYDVSRGRVPTLAFLKRLARRLSSVRINHLELYVEHTFAFEFDPEISAGCSPLTPAEIREFDAFCQTRGVTLVPSLATFGHMGRILSLPQYRALAEVPVDKPFEELTWAQRVRGLTLDVTNPASRELLSKMLAEYLPCFSAAQFNVCCDETFDLGQGRGKQHAAKVGAGRMFLDHIRWLKDEADKYGKQILFWGDMLKKYPEIIPELPEDGVVLNWGYAADADYDSTQLFRDAGRETWVCPGVATWNRFISDLPEAETNIRRYCAAGARYGATGVLNTEWGDNGHIAPPAATSYAFALGGVLAWNTSGPDDATFDAAFAQQCLTAGAAPLFGDWREVCAMSPMTRTWPLCCGPLTESVDAAEWSDASLVEWEQRAGAIAHNVRTLNVGAADWFNQTDRAELMMAFELHAWAARRLRLGRLVKDQPSPSDVAKAELAQFAAETRALSAEYARIWRAQHKEAYLGEIVAVLLRLADEAEQAAGKVKGT